MILSKLLFPPKWVLTVIPPLSFAVLALIFVTGSKKNMPTYIIYFMSAYSLTICISAVPALIRTLHKAFQNSKTAQKLTHTEFAERYLSDLAFRGGISIYQGIVIDCFYAIFRMIAGICYASVWFITMAVYHLVLGIMRTYLVVCYRRRTPIREYRCCHTTAWLLFLLNVPMGGMIVLTVLTNSGFSYPGYVIYLSALYTFYTMVTAVINLVKFKRLGSPILSVARALNFIAAMMSIFGLQTAMISHFSESGESYRKTMNTITGGFVYVTVILIAVYMLICSRSLKKKVESIE